jgi:hypothetical protein
MQRLTTFGGLKSANRSTAEDACAISGGVGKTLSQVGQHGTGMNKAVECESNNCQRTFRDTTFSGLPRLGPAVVSFRCSVLGTRGCLGFFLPALRLGGATSGRSVPQCANAPTDGVAVLAEAFFVEWASSYVPFDRLSGLT